MPKLYGDLQLTEEQQVQWMRLAHRWNCTIEEAIERAGLEMADQLPDAEFEQSGNVIFLEQAQ